MAILVDQKGSNPEAPSPPEVPQQPHQGATNIEGTDFEKITTTPTVLEPYSAFPPHQRRLIIAMVTAAGFFGPLSGAIYLPVLPILEDAFSVSASVINATVSVFMVVFAIAPLLWAAGADFGGRKTVYLLSLALFILVNVLLATVPANIVALFILRVFQAFGSCGVTSVGAGTVADVTEPHHRASALGLFLLGPQIGPILGPVIGGPLASAASWRWIFGFLAISCFVVYVSMLFFLPETLRSLVGNGSSYANKGWIYRPRLRQRRQVDSGHYPPPPRPNPKLFIRLLKYPPTFIVSINGALLFAAYYAMAINFPRSLKHIYGFSTAEVGVAYLAPGIALLAGSMIGGKVTDRSYKRWMKQHPNEIVPPERRIHDQIYGFIVSASGILMYGWFSHAHIHVSATLLASFLAGFGMTWVFVSSTSYQTECAPRHAATLVALAGLFRNIAAAIAAAIIDRLTQRMGLGWCFTGLAIMDLLGIIGVIVIIRRGPIWKKLWDEKETSK